jgi:DnaK suppressor protein
MTKGKVEKFRRALEARVVELDGSTRRRDAIVIECSADELDRGLCATERELAVRNLEAIAAKQREARAALRRIAVGRYGICVDCREPIGPARLAALPWAALCIRCQETDDCQCAARSARPVLAMAA